MLGTAVLAAVIALLALLGDPLNLQPTLLDWTSASSASTASTWSSIAQRMTPIEPTDYMARAKRLLQSTPLIDGHNDFPYLLRQQLHNEIYDHDFASERIGSHSDFQRMKDGMMGGQFWSVYVPCPEDLVSGVDLSDPNRRIPDLNEPNVCVYHTLPLPNPLIPDASRAMNNIDVFRSASGRSETRSSKSTSPSVWWLTTRLSSNSASNLHVSVAPTEEAG